MVTVMGLINDIKRNAHNNGTKIQSGEATELERLFNKMFYLPKDIESEVAFIGQVITRGLETQERSGLHASALIVGDSKWCMRQQVLSLMYKQLQGEQTPIGLKRVFEEGNAVHEKWQRLFLRAGYSRVNELDVTRFNPKWRVSYTPDIECVIPEFFAGKMIGELKSVNTFQFQKMVKHPSAWKQCQWYMRLSIAREKAAGTWNGKDYTKGFVISEDKNTQDFKVEVYDINTEVTEPFVTRCKEIKAAYKKFKVDGTMVSRPNDAKDFSCKRCKECPMRDACWNIGGGRIKL